MRATLPDDVYAAVEESVYEAAVVPELWPKVLEQLGTITDTAGGAFVAMNERGVHIVCAPVMNGVARKIIDQGYMDRSGRAQGVIGKGLVGVPRFLNEHDYYDSMADAETDAIVTECFRPAGLGWAAGWLIQLPHGDTLIMNVEQFFERGPIEGETLKLLDSLYPVFARGATLGARIDFARTRTAIETLAAVGMPGAAVTPTGRVVLANEAFEKATHAWTVRAGDRLALVDRTADRMLMEALGAIRLAQSPRSIPLRATAGGPVVAVIQVVPVRRAAHDIFGSTAAIVILSEPKQQVADATLVHSLFDLTPAELAVAQAMATGQSPAQIAKASGRSVATVRNQLKSAMQKTGSSRQIELALLMRQLGRPAS